MHVYKLQLRNFKRFSDLTIDLSGLENPPKLVVLIGSNGSGKSSVFDAFELLSNITKGGPRIFDSDKYYSKIDGQQPQIQINDYSSLVSKTSPPPRIDAFYGRTSMRQVPKLSRKYIGNNQISLEKDSDRPRQFIDRDERFENDLEHITKLILQDVFRTKRNTEEIINAYLTPINDAFVNIFGVDVKTDLRFKSFAPPSEGKVAEILFQKGSSEIHYDLLSSGEKEVFNILINLLSRRAFYHDTVYFFDELDLHLNTALQYNLLKEITENWIPENCQLWTASHSLGFIDYANQTDHSAIIDFDDLDFDVQQVLFPKEKNRLEIYEVAVPQKMLFKIFEGKKVVLCENQNDEYYNLLGLENTIFLGVKDSNEVFYKTKANAGYIGLRDRDLLMDNEIEKLEKNYPNYKILRYYSFESYLYHPDNIADLNLKDFDKEAYIQEITRQKNVKYDSILISVNSSRMGYSEFKDKDIKNKESDALIIKSLSSDEFEQFYSFFDMKNQFNKSVIAKFNLSKEQLVQTQWFKTRIGQVLGF